MDRVRDIAESSSCFAWASATLLLTTPHNAGQSELGFAYSL